RRRPRRGQELLQREKTHQVCSSDKSWSIDPIRAARRANLYHCMVTNVLIRRRRWNGSSMTRLKVNLHHSRNLVGIRGSRDSSNALGIEAYFVGISILIPRGQASSAGPCEWLDRT